MSSFLYNFYPLTLSVRRAVFAYAKRLRERRTNDFKNPLAVGVYL